MKKNQIMQDRYQGILIVAFAIVAQQGPEDLPNDVPDNPEEELSENEPDETPEMPDQDDLGIDEELGDEEENEFPKLDEQEEDERELDNNGSI
ncbi:hypothetical protein HS960_10065 [Sphingobacterium paramultivorum]|uniref:Uncharacterized protein n=1 Tax=Sphingobacterium paramultivorum TaxID=2886510 RepID=A0A7G5E1V8_9SPHI|nr:MULTISPECIES: hypothetical protein [Sphingobacterium]MCS4167919.1 hypothetical protein [Sphingobacterium sp. BIGb0116]QMV67983.1 hypothetical protein HS960_10065 [Sphingobacterium paramultivorum]WSO16883.1 hypothetical protein VUL84_10050 [Sphingobacterium paramultivorum]